MYLNFPFLEFCLKVWIHLPNVLTSYNPAWTNIKSSFGDVNQFYVFRDFQNFVLKSIL